jgi:hypothetical protein
VTEQKKDPPTVDQIRESIDRGKTGDKTPGFDPAAAPLGTDAEAGGAPPTREERAMERDALERAGARPEKHPRRPTDAEPRG